jgi:hypothetical protein
VLAAYLATADTTPGAIGQLLRNGNPIGPYQVSFGLPLNDTVIVGWHIQAGTTLGVSASGLGAAVSSTLVVYFALPDDCQ